MYREAFKTLLGSIVGNDFYILVVALADLAMFILTLIFANSVKKREKAWKIIKNRSFSLYVHRLLSISYTIFTTLITIFPLLGMFGTVCGLLGLDLANGDMSNIKENFFIALTSTAWGIIFAALFKILNAFIENYVEDKIELAKELSIKKSGLKEDA